MGRPKGSPNKKTQNLVDLCEEHGFHPFVEMILNYKTIKASGEASKAFDAAERIAQYIFPKKRAVEVSGEDGKPVFEIVIKDYTSK